MRIVICLALAWVFLVLCVHQRQQRDNEGAVGGLLPIKPTGPTVRRRTLGSYSSIVVDSSHDGHKSKGGDTNLHWASQDTSDNKKVIEDADKSYHDGLHGGDGKEHPKGKGHGQGNGRASGKGKGNGHAGGKGKGATKIHRGSASQVAGRSSEIESSVDTSGEGKGHEHLSNDPINHSDLDDDYYDDYYKADDFNYYENGNCWKPCKGKDIHKSPPHGTGSKGNAGSHKYGSSGDDHYQKKSGTHDPAHHVKGGNGKAGSHKYGGIDNHHYNSKSGVNKPKRPVIGGKGKDGSHKYASSDNDHYHSKSDTHKPVHSSKGIKGKTAGYEENHKQYGEEGGPKEALSPRSERVKEWERTIIEDIFGEGQEYSRDDGFSYHYDDDVGFGAKARAKNVDKKGGGKERTKTDMAEQAVKTSNLHTKENWSKKNSHEGGHSDDGEHYPRSIYYKF